MYTWCHKNAAFFSVLLSCQHQTVPLAALPVWTYGLYFPSAPACHMSLIMSTCFLLSLIAHPVKFFHIRFPLSSDCSYLLSFAHAKLCIFGTLVHAHSLCVFYLFSLNFIKIFLHSILIWRHLHSWHILASKQCRGLTVYNSYNVMSIKYNNKQTKSVILEQIKIVDNLW